MTKENLTIDGSVKFNRTKEQLEATKALLFANKKKFEEEKENLKDKLAQMNLKMMLVQENCEKLSKQAELGTTLKDIVDTLQNDKYKLVKTLFETKELLDVQRKKCEEEATKLCQKEKELQLLKSTEVTLLKTKIEELKEKLNNYEEICKKLKEEKEILVKEKLQFDSMVFKLESEKTRLAFEIDQIKQEDKQINQEQQKIIRDNEKSIRELRLKIKEKEDTLKEVENERKENEKDADEKFVEACKEISLLKKKIQHLESAGKKKKREIILKEIKKLIASNKK